jgi:hypothetical protein
MKYNFNDTLSVKKLLELRTDEQIMELMGVPVIERRFCSPYRNDNNPTCSLWRGDNGFLYYMDWAAMTDPVDFVDLYRHLNDCDFKEALEGILKMINDNVPAQNFVTNIVHESRTATETLIKADQRPFAFVDLQWWGRFGISEETLKFFKVQALLRAWVGNDMIYQYIPEAGVRPAYLYRNAGIKLYFPHRDYNRFYQNNGKAVQGYMELPATGKLLVITKALKDIMLFYELGIASIAAQSEGVVLDDALLTELSSRFEYILVLLDNDRAGIIGLRKYKKLGLDIFMFPRKSGSKDFTDYRYRNGPDRTYNLVQEVRSAYLNGRRLSLNEFSNI